ncbi:hypothetical protein IMZ48_19940 [Candidatus Bathyarchaeota archaeon]|nr:hypothetical protein [Candidatus Bathyarchaeota archaeon]
MLDQAAAPLPPTSRPPSRHQRTPTKLCVSFSRRPGIKGSFFSKPLACFASAVLMALHRWSLGRWLLTPRAADDARAAPSFYLPSNESFGHCFFDYDLGIVPLAFHRARNHYLLDAEITTALPPLLDP